MNRTIQTTSTHSIQLEEQEAPALREALRVAVVVLRILSPDTDQLAAAALDQADIDGAANQLGQLAGIIA